MFFDYFENLVGKNVFHFTGGLVRKLGRHAEFLKPEGNDSESFAKAFGFFLAEGSKIDASRMIGLNIAVPDEYSEGFADRRRTYIEFFGDVLGFDLTLSFL